MVLTSPLDKLMNWTRPLTRHLDVTGRGLRSLGESHLAVGRAQLDLNDAIAMRVLDEMEQLLKTYKEYDKASKEADKARLAQETRLAAVRGPCGGLRGPRVSRTKQGPFYPYS